MDNLFGFLFFAVFFIIVIISVKNQITGKSISKCPNCGRGVSKSLYNCPKCGAELKKKCSNCGQWLSINALSCYACHAKCNDMSANNMSNTLKQYTQYANKARTTNTYNSSANNSYNNKTVCTYHDTYSSGNNCDHDYNKKYSSPTYSNFDDIGFVKGRKRNHVETVEDFERARHKTGAYEVNVNEVQSYDRKNSYSMHSDPVFRQNNTIKKAVNKNKGGLIIALIIMAFVIFSTIIPIICAISDFDFSDDTNYETIYEDSGSDYLYASHPYINLSSENIKNEAVLSLLNSVKNDSTLNNEDSMIIFSHYVKGENKYQIVTMRTSGEEDIQYEFFLYYMKSISHFVLDQYEAYGDEQIMNSYVSDNGIRFVQIDYYEYRCEDEEDINKCYIQNNDLPMPTLYLYECDYDISFD